MLRTLVHGVCAAHAAVLAPNDVPVIVPEDAARELPVELGVWSGC